MKLSMKRVWTLTFVIMLMGLCNGGNLNAMPWGSYEDWVRMFPVVPPPNVASVGNETIFYYDLNSEPSLAATGYWRNVNTNKRQAYLFLADMGFHHKFAVGYNINGAAETEGVALRQLGSSEFAIGCNLISFGGQYGKALLKTDQFGNLLQMAFLGPGRVADIEVATNDDILVYGEHNDKLYLARLRASNLSIIWAFYYDNGNTGNIAADLVHDETLDDYLLVGTTKAGSGDSQVAVLRVDALGAIQFGSDFGDVSLNEGGRAAAYRQNNFGLSEYLITGMIEDNQSMIFLKLDNTGAAIVFNKVSGEKLEPLSVTIGTNDRFFVAGKEFGGATTEGFILPMDVDGNIIANMLRYGSQSSGAPVAAADDEFRDITLLPSGELQLSGAFHQNSLSGPEVFWTVRTDANGFDHCYQLLSPVIASTPHSPTGAYVDVPVPPYPAFSFSDYELNYEHLSSCENGYVFSKESIAGAAQQPAVDAANTLHVFPNPATDISRIHYSVPADTRELSAELYDAVGTLVARQSLSTQARQAHIDLSSAARGYYILRIVADGKISARTAISIVQ